MVWVGFALLATVGLVPFLGTLDAAVASQLDGWRSCGAAAVFARVSDLVGPIGLAVLGLALVLRLWTDSPRRVAYMLAVLAALGAGTLLLEAAKFAVERPRPGAEFLLRAGNSFPSGHVGNAVLCGFAVLALWSGPPAARRATGRWLTLGTFVFLVAAARLYEGRHWLSDVMATAGVTTGYAVLAFRHPDGRWRAGATLAALVATGLLYGAAAGGWRLELPGGASSLVRSPLRHLRFGQAHAEGRLEGRWSADGPDPFRRSAWLRAPAGRVVLDGADVPVGEVRIVARPHPGGASATCRRLSVALNGELLGQRLLIFGWRAYRFPIAPHLFRPAGNVLTLSVLNEHPDGRRDGAPLAAFSELTLHGSAVAPPRGEAATPG